YRTLFRSQGADPVPLHLEAMALRVEGRACDGQHGFEAPGQGHDRDPTSSGALAFRAARRQPAGSPGEEPLVAAPCFRGAVARSEASSASIKSTTLPAAGGAAGASSASPWIFFSMAESSASR